MPLRIPFARVDWVNTVFLAIITLTAIIASPIYLWHNGLNWFQGSMMLFYIIATGMSITLGYHRLFSHLSFVAKWPVRLFTLVFGACAFENSALHWCSDHRRHHKHTDHEDDDPYSITNGFFWAHIGWILFKVNPEPPLDNVADLRKDKLVMWQHKWDKAIAFGVGLILPAALGYLYDGPVGALGGFLLAGVLRVVLVQQCTFFINSLCHCVGSQPYSNRCSARDSFVMSLFTFGEGYHNYHHEFQHDYRNGVKPWNFDPTKWAIWLLAKLGLASNLRRVPAARVVLAEIGVTRRAAEASLARISEHHDHAWRETATRMANELMEQLSESCTELEKAVSERMDISRQMIQNWRKETSEIIERLSSLDKKKTPLPA